VKERNSLLLLQNREGILSAYLQDRELLDAANQSIKWSDTPRKGIESLWGGESAELKQLKNESVGFRAIRILDSFFSDTLIREDIRDPIFTRALKGVPVQFLLADPRGAFGKARAEAIKQSAMERSLEGLERLALVCNDVRVRESETWVSREPEIRSAKNKRDWEKVAELLIEVTAGLPVEVKLYQVSPSGPLYFFSDLLIAGRFWAKTTAANLPWEHIIDTPIQGDLYDTMLKEFFYVWDSAKPLAESIYSGPVAANPLVFISCCQADQAIVTELQGRITANGIATYIFWTDTATGVAWPAEVHKALNECGVLVAVLTGNALANSDWVRAEIGGAWALGKHIMQAKVGNTPKLLPGILHEKWAEDITSSAGKDKLIRDIKRYFGK
jgi:hypothetical protein